MRIAALLPVYAQPKSVVEIASILRAEDYPFSEIVIVVDGDTNPEIDAALAELRSFSQVSVIAGKPHLGKAKALNEAAEEVEADALLFLDNDIVVPSGARLFASCASLLEERDLAELPKVGVGKGFVASMCSYEFLANLLATEYLVGKAGRFPSINGAAFVIKKPLFISLGGFKAVVNEDMDLAARAFLAGARFGFDPAMTVKNSVPETAEEWVKQRRRWAINSALWSTVYVARVLKHDPKLGPFLGLSGLIFPLPLIALLAGALLPLIPTSLCGAPEWVAILSSALGALLGYGLVARLFARKAKPYGSHFNALSFLAFTVVYLPLWGMASLMGMISIATGILPELDWKHDEKADLAGLSHKPHRQDAR